MIYSNDPSTRFALIVIRVDDLQTLRNLLKYGQCNWHWYPNHVVQAIQRISEEVDSTIDNYRRNSDEN